MRLAMAHAASARIARRLRSGQRDCLACCLPSASWRRRSPPAAGRIRAGREFRSRVTVARIQATPAGFQNSATGLDLGFYAARSYSPSRPARTPAVLPRRQDQEDSHGLGGWLRLARCPVSRDRGPGSGQGPSPRRFFRDARLVRAPAPRHRSQGAGLSPSRRPGTSWKLRNQRRWLFFLALAQYPANAVIAGHSRD